MLASSCTINRDHPPAVIVDAHAPAPVRFAAHELKKYLAQILGVALPETASSSIRLWSEADAALGDEGFEISADGHDLYIRGGGVVYGAYEFLRRYADCRFSGLGPGGEYVPRLDRIEVRELPLRMQPALWYRGLQCYRQCDKERMIEQLDWMAKNGLNYIMFSPLVDGLTIKDEDGFDPDTGDKRTRSAAGRYTNSWYRRQIMPEALKRGLKLDMNHHNLLTWLPPEVYFKEHPEWYRLVDGKRTAAPVQLCICTSNREAVSTLIANVRKYIRENPEVKIVGVIPEDGLGMCQCAECRKLDRHPDGAPRPSYLTPAGENRNLIKRYAALVNEVARQVRQEFPNMLIGYAAYVDLQWPPRDIELEDNIVPWVAMYGKRCYTHRLGPDGCEPNRFLFDILKQWRTAHKGRTILYEYYMGRGGYMSLPFPIAGQICREWPELKRIGIQGATVQSSPLNMSIYGLNYLAFARNGWQDQVNYEKLLDDYLLGMFGSAAAEIRPVYAALDKVMARIAQGDPRNSPYLRETGSEHCTANGRNIRFFLDETGVGFIRACVQRALKRAQDERERRQVEAFAEAVAYWQKLAELYVARDNLLAAKQAGQTGVAAALAAECSTKLADLNEYQKRLPAKGWGSGDADFALRLGLARTGD